MNKDKRTWMKLDFILWNYKSKYKIFMIFKIWLANNNNQSAIKEGLISSMIYSELRNSNYWGQLQKQLQFRLSEKHGI